MSTDINKFFIGNIAPNRTVFYRGAHAISYVEFSSDVARFANIFAGIDGDTVILFVPDDIYLFCVYFMALMQAGRDVVLPAMLNMQNAQTLRDTTNTIVTNQKLNLDGFDIVDTTQNRGNDWNFCDMDNRRIYFFTSGSTGTPKKICKTFHNLAAEVRQHCKMQSAIFDTRPVMVASIAPYHMYGLLWRFLIPLGAGIAIDTNLIFTPEELQAAQNKFEHILFATTPSFLDSITKYQNQYVFKNNCIGIFSSGSLLDAKTSNAAFEKFGVSPFEVFGSTETGGVAYRQQKNGVLWTVFDDVNVSLGDDNCIVADSEFCCVRPYPMSDVIEMQNARQFILHGRADRVVKIAEERISLPEYEEKLNVHKFVERAVVTTLSQNSRIVIGCVLVLNDAGRDFIISNGRRNLIQNIKDYLAAYFPNVALPRKIRIVNVIPMNTQGKILKAEVAEILRSKVAEPVAKNIIKTDKSWAADLVFLDDAEYFKGHFDGYPILPGVIQLHFVMRFIRLFFGTDARAYDISKLKFSNLILPNTTVHFELNKCGDNEFSFSYENGDIKYSAGKIVIKE